MEVINLNGIDLSVWQRGNDVIVKSVDKNMLLENQRVESITVLIKQNFNVIWHHYSEIAKNQINSNDITQVSLAVMLYYLYMYNSWRNTYTKSNYQLTFNEKDFSRPSTSDIIIGYFKENCPDTWKDKSITLLQMTMEEFMNYYDERQKYYNK